MVSRHGSSITFPSARPNGGNLRASSCTRPPTGNTATVDVTRRVSSIVSEHRIERAGEDYVASGNAWGFSMNAPELLYDRGELHNLLVARGTLTAEERFKINEHIIQTIVMLSELPFPKSMRNVPEIAGGHHEKMDGTGYPKGLKRR